MSRRTKEQLSIKFADKLDCKLIYIQWEKLLQSSFNRLKGLFHFCATFAWPKFSQKIATHVIVLKLVWSRDIFSWLANNFQIRDTGFQQSLVFVVFKYGLSFLPLCSKACFTIVRHLKRFVSFWKTLETLQSFFPKRLLWQWSEDCLLCPDQERITEF